MADTNIKFKLSSMFDGEGFKAAEAAIRNNTKEINAAKAGLGELTNAISAVSPAAAQGTSAVKTFAGAFAAGGIVGGVIQLAVIGVAKAVEYVGQKMKEAEEAAKSYAAILRDRLSSSLSESGESFRRFAKDVEDANALLRNTVSFLNGLSAADVRMKVADVYSETMQKVNDEMSATGKKMIEASAEVTVQEIKNKATLEKLQREREADVEIFQNLRRQREAAEDAMATATSKLGEAQKLAAEYVNRRKELEDRLQAIEEAYAEGRVSENTILKRRQEFALKLAELDEQNKAQKEFLASAQQRELDAKAALEDVTRKLTAQSDKLELGMANEEATRKECELALKRLTKKYDEAADAFGNESDSPFAADNPGGEGGEWELAPILEILQKSHQVLDTSLRPDIDSLKRNQGKVNFQANQSVKVINSELTPYLPSLDEIKKARVAAEKQPENLLNEAKKRYGYMATQYISYLNTNGYKRTEANAKFKDFKTAMAGLPADVAAKLMMDAADRVLLKKDLQAFFNDWPTVLKWIQKGREPQGGGGGEGAEPADLSTLETNVTSINSNTTGISNGIANLKDALTECLTVK